MPEINGLEVCRIIRNEDALSDMKVLIITGFPNASVLREIAALGFTHVEPKPINISTLGEKIDAILKETVRR